MSGVNSLNPIPEKWQVVDQDAVAVSDDISQAPRGEHEDEENVHGATTESVAGDEIALEPASRPIVDTHESYVVLSTADLAPDAPEAKAPSAAAELRSSVSVKPPLGKSIGGLATPTVKKIINSGTFGAGTVKSSAVKPSITTNNAAVKPASTALLLKKSTSSSSSPSKPSMASARAPAPSAAAPPSRRLSIIPPKPSAVSTSKPPVKTTASASAAVKPSPAASATRPSVVSPSSSVASSASRPRASVSEGVKRTPLSSRQSLSAATKPITATSSKAPPARSSGAVPTKLTRATNSISSIREVVEDGKVLEELQIKLKEVSDSLASKTEASVDMEGQIATLQSSLQSALADVETNKELVAQLGQDKSLLEVQLSETEEVISSLQSEHQAGESELESLRADLAASKVAITSQNELVQNLHAQIQALETEVLSSKEQLETLQVSKASEASVAASIEHDALLKAHADEIEALKVAHREALQGMQDKLKDLEHRAAAVDNLEAALTRVKEEKEETVGKLSELEVEILELKESQELVEDRRAQSLVHIKAVEEDLLKATSAKQQAIDEAKAKEADHVTLLDDIKKHHHEALQVASEERKNMVLALEALKGELATSMAAHEQVKIDVQAALVEHARQLEEAEQIHMRRQTELSEEIKKITAELENQEAHYNSKVDALKHEHGRLVQDAFERAKNEAGAEHAQELQSLRADSTATVEQIRAANQSALEDLKTEHASILESELNRLEKQINALKLDLKATQDDLAKAKAALESARGEIENLTAQRDEGLAAAASAPQATPEHVEEMNRLLKELFNTKDDLAAVTDMLNLSKVSLTEMSHNHTKELEEAAKARAEEVMKLRSTHDEEVTSLAAGKSELLVRLSDLEGDLATLRATISSETVAPKSNSNGVAHLAQGVTKEELHRMHEAHNLKMYDLEAEHEKAIKALKLELEVSESRMEEVRQEVERKAMEIQYLEQDQEESQEQITRLKEDVDALTERLNKEQAPSA